MSAAMKWIMNPTALSFEHYTLFEKDAPVLDLKFNYHTNTARISLEGEKRAFMIDNASSLRNKILLLNEYGLEFGQLSYENEISSEGFVQIENKELRYVIDSSIQPRVIFYNESSPVPVISCLLPERKAIDFSLNKNIKNNVASAALILLMGWYLRVPVLEKTSGLVAS